MQNTANSKGEDIEISTKKSKTGPRSHPIKDGNKYTGIGNYGTDHKYGTHVEIVESSADMATNFLLEKPFEFGIEDHIVIFVDIPLQPLIIEFPLKTPRIKALHAAFKYGIQKQVTSIVTGAKPI